MSRPSRSLNISWPFGRSAVDAPPAGTPAVPVVPLTPALAGALRLPWSSRFTPGALARFLAGSPGWAWTVPDSGEYLIADRWRRRDDVAVVAELRARRQVPPLLEAATAALATAGVGALLVPEGDWPALNGLYAPHGFGLIEKILYYQIAALLAEALTRMAARGVTRVTLSTQETNVQSQRLYRGFGFRRTSDFHLIYGRWLGEPRGM